MKRIIIDSKVPVELLCCGGLIKERLTAVLLV